MSKFKTGPAASAGFVIDWMPSKSISRGGKGKSISPPPPPLLPPSNEPSTPKKRKLSKVYSCYRYAHAVTK
ncbi:hypothetical protein ED733_000188 [Metarhizium rileyi]|uniref:Uncharacterized protein n=1 Tax=Metarhizium rileyi (strain RCEF 4871) TaxID=1649241 RepID=A0A5C6FY21_METRR|nr:hypothetical protein ED733_000188 [Metarhizium rileyi]